MTQRGTSTGIFTSTTTGNGGIRESAIFPRLNSRAAIFVQYDTLSDNENGGRSGVQFALEFGVQFGWIFHLTSEPLPYTTRYHLHVTWLLNRYPVRGFPLKC